MQRTHHCPSGRGAEDSPHPPNRKSKVKMDPKKPGILMEPLKTAAYVP